MGKENFSNYVTMLFPIADGLSEIETIRSSLDTLHRGMERGSPITATLMEYYQLASRLSELKSLSLRLGLISYKNSRNLLKPPS